MLAPVVFGVDPGSRWIGWASLVIISGSAVDVRGRFVAAGVIDLSEGEDAIGRLEALAHVHEPGLVAIERVGEVHPVPGGIGARRATDLVGAAWVGGRLADRLLRAGFPPRTFPAEEWRRHFITAVSPRERAERKARGERVNTDRVVKALVEERVVGWPRKLPGVYARDACHARDAACVALYAGYLIRGG